MNRSTALDRWIAPLKMNGKLKIAVFGVVDVGVEFGVVEVF